MKTFSRRAVLLTACGGLISSALAASAAELEEDYTAFDLEAAGIADVAPVKDERTGFIIGGKNDTAFIRRLTELNGRTINELEADMRPGAKTEVASDSGFLGKDESLLHVLANDNELVLKELRLTHQILAAHLHALGAIGTRLTAQSKHPVFRYHNRRFEVDVQHSRGYQLSPFRDGTKSGSNATVTNLDSGEKISYALLVPYMIARYGFYEGNGTPYRVDPRQVVKVLDFVAKKD